MKTALITGGSRGIGAEAVRRFSQSGYKVVFTYNRSDSWAQLLSEQTGAVAVQSDITNPSDTQSMVSTMIERLGHIDVLINNAGISNHSLLMDATDEDYRSVFDVNVYGTFSVTRAVLPHMLEQRSGSIINVSSMWGETGAAGETIYSASKAAVIGLTKALAKEVASANIRVNCVSPGVIATQMNDHLTMNDYKELCHWTPLQHVGKTEDVVNAMLFLAGPESAFITGQVLSVNGGMVI